MSIPDDPQIAKLLFYFLQLMEHRGLTSEPRVDGYALVSRHIEWDLYRKVLDNRGFGDTLDVLAGTVVVINARAPNHRPWICVMRSDDPELTLPRDDRVMPRTIGGDWDHGEQRLRNGSWSLVAYATERTWKNFFWFDGAAEIAEMFCFGLPLTHHDVLDHRDSSRKRR